MTKILPTKDSVDDTYSENEDDIYIDEISMAENNERILATKEQNWEKYREEAWMDHGYEDEGNENIDCEAIDEQDIFDFSGPIESDYAPFLEKNPFFSDEMPIDLSSDEESEESVKKFSLAKVETAEDEENTTEFDDASYESDESYESESDDENTDTEPPPAKYSKVDSSDNQEKNNVEDSDELDDYDEDADDDEDDEIRKIVENATKINISKRSSDGITDIEIPPAKYSKVETSDNQEKNNAENYTSDDSDELDDYDESEDEDDETAEDKEKAKGETSDVEDYMSDDSDELDDYDESEDESVKSFSLTKVEATKILEDSKDESVKDFSLTKVEATKILEDSKDETVKDISLTKVEAPKILEDSKDDTTKRKSKLVKSTPEEKKLIASVAYYHNQTIEELESFCEMSKDRLSSRFKDDQSGLINHYKIVQKMLNLRLRKHATYSRNLQKKIHQRAVSEFKVKASEHVKDIKTKTWFDKCVLKLLVHNAQNIKNLENRLKKQYQQVMTPFKNQIILEFE